MKQYIIGFITGACLIAIAVMFMGVGESNSKIGKYQGFAYGTNRTSEIYLLDTEIGLLYDLGYDESANRYYWRSRQYVDTALR